MNASTARERAAFPAALLDVRPQSFLRRSGGRETFLWRLDPGDPGDPREPRSVVVKRTLGADLVAGLAASLGLHGSGTRPSGRREFEALEALRQDGIPVPRAITWCEEREGNLARGARSLVVMEHVAHRDTLRERIARADGEQRARWAKALLDVVSRLHERGWIHRDLYLQHFLVPEPREAESPPLVLIDVGRARRERSPRRRWHVKDLAALSMSCPAVVLPRERLRFLAGWLDRRGIADRDERRWWGRAVAAKAARMAAHVPRDERGAP